MKAFLFLPFLLAPFLSPIFIHAGFTHISKNPRLGQNQKIQKAVPPDRLINHVSAIRKVISPYDSASDSLVRPDGEFSTISYDQNGNRLTVTDHRNNTTTWSYDNLNREKTRTNPTGIETVSTTFDPNGNITQILTQEGEPINFTHNPDNLLTQQDFGGETLNWSYDPRGNVLTENNSVSQITNTYDDLNRPLTITIAATTEQEALALSLGYDTRGNLVGINDGDGSIVQSFNANGLIETLTTPLGKTLTFSYNDNNLLTQIDFDGQMTTTYQFDNKSRLTNINSLQGVTPIDSHAYQFDQVDLRTSHFIQGLGTASYQYDQIDRLASAGHDYTQVPQEVFNMDPEGNILSSHDQASTTFDVANRYSAHPDYNFTFDKKGNLTQKVKISNNDKTVYTWNAVNQMTKLEFFALGGGISSPTLDFSYDPQGRRVSRTLNGTDKTSWIYMGPHIHREYRNGTLSKRFIYGAGIDNILAAEIDTNSDGTLDSTHFYLKDALNTVSVIADNLGNPLQRYVFDSYGALKEIQDGASSPITTASPNWIDQPFTYTSREYDWTTGLMHYRARTYDPVLKRFLSEDPVWATNPYWYVDSDPINLNDPLGKFLQGLPPSFWRAIYDGFRRLIIQNRVRIANWSKELAKELAKNCPNLKVIQRLRSLIKNAQELLIKAEKAIAELTIKIKGLIEFFRERLRDIIKETAQRGAQELPNSAKAIQKIIENLENIF